MVSVVSSAYTRCTLVANLSCGFPSSLHVGTTDKSPVFSALNEAAQAKSCANSTILLFSFTKVFVKLCLSFIKNRHKFLSLLFGESTKPTEAFSTSNVRARGREREDDENVLTS